MNRWKLLLGTFFFLALAITGRMVSAQVPNPPIGGIDFPAGPQSFADAVVEYAPGNPTPLPAYQRESHAIGSPDFNGLTKCPSANDCSFLSLGLGGSVTLRFVDNSLTGSGDAKDDLWIFEVGGDVEDMVVEISQDGRRWFQLGTSTGGKRGIDIDRFGFGPELRFQFVRLKDDPGQGSTAGGSVGADIDAVGAISSADPITATISVPATATAARPSGTPSVTTPTVPTHAADPVPIYLPLLLDEACPPKGLFLDLVLVIDASTSMRERTTDGRRKIDLAIESAQVLLDGLRLAPGQDRVALITFNASEHWMSRLTEDKTQLIDSLAGITTSQQSRVDLGISAAQGELESGGRPQQLHTMIVLSDGRSNPVTGAQVISTAHDAQSAGIEMYVVGMGPSMDEHVLRRMASSPRHYTSALDPMWTPRIFQRLARQIPCAIDRHWGRR